MKCRAISREKTKPMNKYKNEKIICDGITFDSKKEAARYGELKLLLMAGKIMDLNMQVHYELIPAQYEDASEVYKIGKNKGMHKRRLVERKCEYIADFVYIDLETGQTVVEDVKGYRDHSSAAYAKYIIKRKLMLERNGIKIREV